MWAIKIKDRVKIEDLTTLRWRATQLDKLDKLNRILLMLRES